MNNKFKILGIAVIGIVIDQLVKFLIETNITLRSSITVIKDFFYITYVRNTGGAWGILAGNILFLILITIVFIYILIKYISNEKKISLIQTISYGFIISGILGNLIDRLFRGYVVDMFHTYIFSYDFPVFNIADSLIVVGVIFMIIDMVRSDIHEHSSRKK